MKNKLKNRIFKSLKNTVLFRLSISLMIIFLLTSVVSFVFSFGTTDLITYAASFEKIAVRENIVEKDSTGYYSIRVQNSSDKTPIKILQLTDVHIGNGFLSYDSDYYALDSMYKIIKEASPDLIIATGDMAYPVFFQSGTSNNLEETRIFGTFMEAVGIPWAFAFGNHDSETYGTHTKDDLVSYYESLSVSNGGNCLFVSDKRLHSLANDYDPEQIYGDYYEADGDSNYFVNILNSDGTFNTACVLIDSNMYVDGSLTDGYDNIHENQIEWYERELNRVSAYYNEKESTTGIKKSLAFFHIPNREYLYIWNELEKSGNMKKDEHGTYFDAETKVMVDGYEATYHYGYMGEGYHDNGAPIISVPKYGDNFFKKAVELGSTKGIFVGHDHKNTYSVTYRGINLNFGLSIDNLAYVKQDDLAYRGGTVISLSDTVENDWNMQITQLKLADIQD